MYQHNEEEIFVIDGHVHYWDATEENIDHRGGEEFIQCFHDYHTTFTPEERQWDIDEYRKYSDDRMVEDLFGNAAADMAIFQPTYLTDFYTEGFNTTERCSDLASEYPDRFELNGTFDPRDGDEGLEYLEELHEKYDIPGVKLYTAEWRGDSKGWRLDDEDAFEFLEKCSELGIENIHAHKGPTIRPLNRDAFDVGDIDDAASSFPELNFVVEHVGLPRLDDFCWIATQENNVYGGLAVAASFAQNRPGRFSEILSELLWWLGEDRVLFGSDYAIWNPDWLVEEVIEAELLQEHRMEYGVEWDLETKKKVMGENIAELYDIDIEEKRRQFQDDEISERFDLEDHYASGEPAPADD